jgi:hypothetical protein
MFTNGLEVVAGTMLIAKSLGDLNSLFEVEHNYANFWTLTPKFDSPYKFSADLNPTRHDGVQAKFYVRESDQYYWEFRPYISSMLAAIRTMLTEVAEMTPDEN